ncbi:hypothetical protein BB559_002234 [Furculomyces boomerangus]|uniref:Peptidase S8/S53 domain-containing protein n=1 Tax=Furculomyces boomerangus TaxID=61424 RepID=A0A2T9YX09_9FUNG|nr:hypothetical protein BB559_002234 [Furculomyces boomerangus]
MINLLNVSLFISAVLAGSQHVFNQVNMASLITPPGDLVIPGRYIVMLKESAGSNKQKFNSHLNFVKTFAKIANTKANSNTNEIDQVYDGEFFGYAGSFDEDVLQYIRYSEDNGINKCSRKTVGKGPYNYIYNPDGGKGVSVYVFDTGVNIYHEDFEGRAQYGIVTSPNTDPKDNMGHGTHVSGTIAGKTLGVAKKANIISVKVFSQNGTSTASGFLRGISFAVNDHVNKTKLAKANNTPLPKSVANASLGTGVSLTINNAVDTSNRVGVTFIVSAGNVNKDACLYSPASSPTSICVGAIDNYDVRSVYSNYGNCTNIFGPGNFIRSTWYTSNNSTAVLSGTSMASPHVAGIVAIYQSFSGPKPYPYDVIKSLIINNGTTGLITNPGPLSPNIIAYSNPPPS